MKREYCPTCHRALPKPLPRVRKKPRRVSVNRDPGYRRWLREQVCAVATHHLHDCVYGPHSTNGSGFYSTDPAHTQNNGMRSKGPDSSCAPMCRKHHTEYDQGRKGFEAKYGVNMAAIAKEHYARYLKEIAADAQG